MLGIQRRHLVTVTNRATATLNRRAPQIDPLMLFLKPRPWPGSA
jgi:hypothetical protein